MAWCPDCERYLTPPTLSSEGACPDCGEQVEHPTERQVEHPTERGEPDVERIPWHFWLAVGAAVVYLVWRVVQGAALLL
ncbi:MAG: hypothetical protein OXE79_08450 [Acidimicrobiaceae bacterium]|nr:hypothetical protein [Acidimicrobiaceae bacterium]MCY4175673.1 hypothetical protein [Acidimicrobiaceae bacterium]MCY4294772.1 hypothetical protein [Acidimicrobiaceae bacterium]